MEEEIIRISPKDWIIFRDQLDRFLEKTNRKYYLFSAGLRIKYKVTGSFYQGYRIGMFFTLNIVDIPKKQRESIGRTIGKLFNQYIPGLVFITHEVESGTSLLITYCPLIKVRYKV
jgi:hypothetical protein